MPDPYFMQLYEGAVARDCPAIWHFFAHRQAVGTDWLALIAYADNLVKLGEEFINGMNQVAQARGLNKLVRCTDGQKREPILPVCQNCHREDCPGTTKMMGRATSHVSVVDVGTQPEL